MKVSVIVPIYNIGRHLVCRCINSLLGQQHQDLEIILVNDGSTDDSPQVCAEFAQCHSQIKLIHQENQGPGTAKATGVQHATGEYICFIDSDDFVSPLYISTMLEMCRQHKTTMAVTGYSLTDEVSTLENTPVTLQLSPTEVIDFSNYMQRINTPVEIVYVTLWGKLFHRSLFDDAQMPFGRFIDDEALIHQLAYYAKSIAVCYQTLYFYTVRTGSIMNTKGFSVKKMDLFLAYQERIDFLSEKGLQDLVFLTQKKYLVEALAFYNSLTDCTPQENLYKSHLKEMFHLMLKSAAKNPCASKKFILKMYFYKWNKKAFLKTTREQLIFDT